VNSSKPAPGQSRWEEFRYEPIPGHWDEALLPSGYPRRHWRTLATALGRMGFRQFLRSWHMGQQLIQSNGVTYNVGGDPAGKERPWPMDPIPLPVPSEEWEWIDRAVQQRATLLNLMLGDVYGRQRLVRERRLPAALVYANPHFQRSCFGITPMGGAPLTTYAVDLARSPDGRWWALGDRTQAPSGIGYALENRLVSARILPGVFNHCRVRPLTHFLDAKRDALLSMAPGRRDTPRVVLLTPGPHNETYFEHSFLAGHWGFPLVEGADLTVRDSRVYLKTLSGLEPVDVILRRMDDGFCDPLELRGDSLLGVPGLMQAVRQGTVAVDNSIGSGVLETPGLMAFLPGLCRDLLGEELILPSVATWWCGQTGPMQYVLEHLDALVIKPAFRKYGLHPVFPARMAAAEKEALIRRIQAQPELFVGQELVNMSTAPVRVEHGLAPRHAGLRVFAARDGDGYRVMPGGLTRVAGEASPVVAMQLGAGSKDTWVFEDDEESAPAPVSVVTRRPGRTSLPSRVADNLFWLGRYAERVDSGVRLIRSLLPALSGEEDFGRAANLETVVRLLAGMRYLPEAAPSWPIGQQRWQLQKLLSALVYDQTRMSGIGWNLKQMRRAAWNLKERLSADTWRVLQQLESDLSRTPPGNPDQRLTAQITLLDSVVVTLAAFSGLVMENMTRGHGFRFLDLGRRLERALQMADLLRAGVVGAPQDNESALQLLLHIADSSITYRSRNLTMLRTELVLDLLVCDETNPRSIGMQLAAIREHVDALPEHAETGRHSLEQRLALKALTMVRLADVEALTRRDDEQRLGALSDLLAGVRTDLFDLSEALTAQYLSHLQTARLRSSD
jgi:uncharacterized circularly permuted ATP-grasp superfamily protein/uncharacterized alpha-E superfamily protein